MSDRRSTGYGRKSWRWACVLVVTAIASTSPVPMAAQDADFDWSNSWNLELFELFTNCESMNLFVEVKNDGENLAGLTEESVGRAVRSRLRSARLLSESGVSNALFVSVRVVGAAFDVGVGFRKVLFDPVTEQYFRTLTFRTGGFGTHGRNGTYVLSVVQQGMDEFLDEYLRVNETACSP